MGGMIARRAVAAALIGATGCAASPDHLASITEVDPRAIYSDVRFDMRIGGEGFWASYEIDTVGGSGTVDETAYGVRLRLSDEGTDSDPIAATSVGWSTNTSLIAKMPVGISKAKHDSSSTVPTNTN